MTQKQFASAIWKIGTAIDAAIAAERELREADDASPALAPIHRAVISCYDADTALIDAYTQQQKEDK